MVAELSAPSDKESHTASRFSILTLDGGALQWGAQFHNVATESQSQLTHTLSKSLIGSAYHRINPRLDFPMAVDDARRAPALKNLSELSEEDEGFLRSHLTQLPMDGSTSASTRG